MDTLGPLVRVRAVEPLQQYRAWVTFEDNTQREIDLEPYLVGPIFESIRADVHLFRSMQVKGNTIAWENGADIDPDVLYYNLTPARLEEAESMQK
jgi:hypothetical protein